MEDGLGAGSLKRNAPKKQKKQPELKTRLKVSDLITTELTEVLKTKGGFSYHKHPAKGNHLDHDLLFNTKHVNLEPASTPARIWRIHPQEHLVRLNLKTSVGFEQEVAPR